MNQKNKTKYILNVFNTCTNGYGKLSSPKSWCKFTFGNRAGQATLEGEDRDA